MSKKNDLLWDAYTALKDVTVFDMTEAQHKVIVKLEDYLQIPPACNHRIADARNKFITAGYICVDCGELFAAADHDKEPPSRLKMGEDL